MKVLKTIAKIITVIMALFVTVIFVWNIILFKTKGEEWAKVCDLGSDVILGN